MSSNNAGRANAPRPTESRPRRGNEASSGTFITEPEVMGDVRRNSILKMAGDIERLKQDKGNGTSKATNNEEEALARKLEDEKHQVQIVIDRKKKKIATELELKEKKKKSQGQGRKGRRRSSIQSGGRRSSTGGRRRMHLTKEHVKVWNHNFDRDEPPPMIMKALAATGEINLKELAEAGGESLLGYPDGNETGDTRSFMLLLS